MFCLLSLGAEASQQENIPPSTPSGTQQSNPVCALSNPSLMSSAPNILQPLTLNSSNGLLETIFPVDPTLSPCSPLAPSGQENSSGNSANCRRRPAIQSRPFSELYSEEVVPLDSDITSPEVSEDSQEVNSDSVVNGNVTVNVNNALDMRTSTNVSNSVDNELSGGVTDQLAGSDNVHLSGEMSASAQESCQNNQDLESQPMDILEETDGVNDSGLSTQIPVINGAIGGTSVGQRTSIGSIELTEDSPLRILEESESRVHEEEIALSSENLLQDRTAESDDELEQMDVTDDTTVAGEDSSLNTDYSMEDVLNISGTGMEESPYENDLINTQPVVYQAAVLLDLASGSPVDEDEGENDLLLSSLEEHEGSHSPPPAVECIPGPCVAAVVLETETRAEVVNAPESSAESQSEYSTLNPQLTTETSEQQRVSEQDVSMSLLEFVNHIVGNDNTEQTNDNEMIVESAEGSTQGASSTPPSIRNSEATVVDSSVETGGAISSVTLPMEATEPVCLNAASLQSSSTSEMLVDATDIVSVDNRMTDDDPATQQSPSKGKRLSRSSSDPRSTHSRRRGERLRNDNGGANQGENSPRLSRPPFVRRITEPVTGQRNSMHPVTVTVNSENDVCVSSSQDTEPAHSMVVTTAVRASVSSTESVVMAVPLSPPLQPTTPAGLTAVVVADGVAEPEALVTPLPSPEFSSEQGAPTFDTLSTAVAVSLSSEVSASAENESPRTAAESSDYVLIIPADDRQPSSAPSTLQRDALPANATVLTNRSRLRSLSQDSPTSVIYATPVSGRSGEIAERYNGSSSFPRQSSTTRVTALSGNRRRNSSSGGSSSTQTRAVPEQPQTLPQGDNHTVPAPARRTASQDSEQSRSERVNNNSSLGATSLPGPSTNSNNDLNQAHQAIQTLLRSFCVQSTEGLPGPSTVGQPTTSSTPVRETEPSRRVPETNHRSGNRRSSGQRQQGHPVYVSIQDQQQTRHQQARPEQQTAEEEPLPSSKKCEVCHLICCSFGLRWSLRLPYCTFQYLIIGNNAS